MKIWKNTPRDAAMLALSVAQFVTTLLFAANWERLSLAGLAGGFVLLVLMMVYNIIVLSHLFTHTPWFESRLLNGLVSVMNSVNIGQSVQAYEFTHVRNHHRYNNDRKGPDGMTKDLSSTYQEGVGGEHATLFRYAFLSAVGTLLNVGRTLLSVGRLWRVGEHEEILRSLASPSPAKRAQELRQVQLDRMAHFAGLCLFLFISWKWTLACYLPAYYLALALVNVQNYYEHYGAAPDNGYADSVSYYGRLYNLLTFNDGYHQEHHLRPRSHWRDMPVLRVKYRDRLDGVERIISPVPAILGILDRNRKQLHRCPAAAPATTRQDSARDEHTFSKAVKGGGS
jgi:fatty acid desaturase